MNNKLQKSIIDLEKELTLLENLIIIKKKKKFNH